MGLRIASLVSQPLLLLPWEAQADRDIDPLGERVAQGEEALADLTHRAQECLEGAFPAGRIGVAAILEQHRDMARGLDLVEALSNATFDLTGGVIPLNPLVALLGTHAISSDNG